ncbi:hypothetical protein B4O99_13360 [Shewanella xiamenensis]|nr:hypothetical protein [Shewanella xiamenensis]
MVICETTVRPRPLFGIHATAAFVNPFTSDGAVEHPRTDSLRVGEQMPLLRMVNSLPPPLSISLIKANFEANRFERYC